MKKSRGSGGNTAKKTTEPSQVSGTHSQVNFIDQLTGIWLQFSRFGRDILGILILVFTVVSLLGLLGMTQGNFMSWWISFLKHWLGWGSFLMVISFGLVGLLCLGRGYVIKIHLGLGRILAIEGLLFTSLALISAIGGHVLERAESGLDGGLVGWGLAELLFMFLPRLFTILILILLFVIFAIISLGLWSFVKRRFEAWLQSSENLLAPPNQSLSSGATVKSNAPMSNGPVDETPPSTLSAQRDERLPPYNLLMQDLESRPDEEQIHDTASRIERSLAEFGIPARVVGYRVGPTITQYAVEPGFMEKVDPNGEVIRQKVRVSQISALGRDLALALSAERLRIEAPVPGQSFVGLEVPNPSSAIVRLRPLLESENMQHMGAPLAVALGRDVSGQPLVADLARMPHLLVAGTTGSGKSVCIAAIITCLVMNNAPNDLRLALLDPKMVELARFNGLPHLYGKVETESERMQVVLRWALVEMDTRYQLLEKARTRDLEAYNKRASRRKEPTLPRIVIMIDELADLMMSSPEQTETNLIRLAQMARATGIHLVVATQRPSTDVITGVIKANFPARLSFTVATAVDSRVILDTNGAETLLGRGDMLFLNPEAGAPVRAQGVIVTDQEIDRVNNFCQKMFPKEIQAAPWEELLIQGEEHAGDDLVEKATEIIRRSQRASTSLLQRRLRIGYPRAARLMDELEELGVVGPSQGGGRDRDVLVNREDGDDLDDDPSTDDR